MNPLVNSQQQRTRLSIRMYSKTTKALPLFRPRGSCDRASVSQRYKVKQVLEINAKKS
jgi:hypothetical protein